MGNTNQIILEKALNVRHLGSIKTIDNKVTKDYAFIRTDSPYNMSENDIDKLISLGVTAVIDLRYEQELKESPNPFKDKKGISYHWVPLMKGSMSKDFDDYDFKNMGDLYTYILKERKDKVAEVFKIIAAQEDSGAIMFHCTIGKDRTGMIAAILLMLANAPEEDIIRDYSISYSNLKPMFDKQFEDESIDMFKGMSREVITDTLHASHPEFIKNFIKELRKIYGTAENFLKENGLNDKEIKAIKSKLI